MKLPKERFGRASWVLHIATYSELNQFARTYQCIVAEHFAKLGIQDLQINIDNDSLLVRFQRDGNNAARTFPFPFSDLPAIKQNNWIRLRYNGRYVHRSTGNWWYEQSCYNIGWFDTFLDDVFLTSQPTSEFEEISALR